MYNEKKFRTMEDDEKRRKLREEALIAISKEKLLNC